MKIANALSIVLGLVLFLIEPLRKSGPTSFGGILIKNEPSPKIS